MSVYSDLTAEFDYKDLITWQNLDKLGENDNYFYDILIDGTDTTQITRSVGSAASPGYSFIGRTGVGGYSSAAQNYDIATNGLQRLNVSSAGLDIKQQLTVTGASRFRANRATAQSILNVTWTVIIYPTEDYDNLSEYNAATGVFTATVAGYYQVIGSAASASVAWDAGEQFVISIYKNGVIIATGLRTFAHAAITDILMSKVNDIVSLNAGDAVSIVVYHSQGAAIDLYNSATYNYFAIHRIS